MTGIFILVGIELFLAFLLWTAITEMHNGN